MIGPAAVFLLFSFLLLYTSPGGWRGRAKPISSTRHPGRSGVTFHLISNNVIINIFSFHSLDWTNFKKKCAVPVSCGPHSHVFYKCILTHMCTHTYTPHTMHTATHKHTHIHTYTHTHSHTLARTHTHTRMHTHTHSLTQHSHTHTHTQPHTHKHTYTPHAMHTATHSHTHTQTNAYSL